MSRVLVVVAYLAVSTPQVMSEPLQPLFRRDTEFSAVDPRDRIDYALGRDLVVRAHRELGAQGTRMGWRLGAVDRRLGDSPNFLYECLCGHGPHPTDILAWHLLKPGDVASVGSLSERILPVWGYPYELQIRCTGCEAEGDGPLSARFIGGTIEINWRRLPLSNPRQKRRADFR
jgi:hypothetical protein